MDLMKEAMKRRQMKGLEITISVAPSKENQEQIEKTSDLAPSPKGDEEQPAQDDLELDQEMEGLSDEQLSAPKSLYEKGMAKKAMQKKGMKA
jgi:hypothetical protein